MASLLRFMFSCLLIFGLLFIIFHVYVDVEDKTEKTEKHITLHSNKKEDVLNDKEMILYNYAFPTFAETIDYEKDDFFVINNPHSELLLVNKQRKLPEAFVPSDLVIPNVLFSFSGYNEKKQIKPIVATALEEMFHDAKLSGHVLYAVSGYRSYERQTRIFNYHVEQYGYEEAILLSAFPGTSEHQTGYAIDISSKAINFALTQAFGDTPEGKWVANNAHKYGFIVRYPKGKTDVTTYDYEPWHLRYVGNPFATFIYDNNLTLEEAYGKKLDKFYAR
jgi:LAS superfamily LD-carboxypeptidase LdcB